MTRGDSRHATFAFVLVFYSSAVPELPGADPDIILIKEKAAARTTHRPHRPRRISQSYLSRILMGGRFERPQRLLRGHGRGGRPQPAPGWGRQDTAGQLENNCGLPMLCDSEFKEKTPTCLFQRGRSFSLILLGGRSTSGGDSQVTRGRFVGRLAVTRSDSR